MLLVSIVVGFAFSWGGGGSKGDVGGDGPGVIGGRFFVADKSNNFL